MTKRALIIGGGIAGPVTAMALQKAGLEPVIYEAYGKAADGVGAFLTVAANGMAGLNLLGLDLAIAELGVDTSKMRMINGGGKVLAELSNAGIGLTIKRADLYEVLRDEAVRRGIPIEYDKRLTDAVIGGEGVRAIFADGSSADGDLLIGADGLRSRTRAIIDPTAPTARYVKLMNTGGFAHGVHLPGEPGVANFVFGSKCFFGYVIHPNREDVWWFANPPRKVEPTAQELAAITPDQWRAELIDQFAEDDGPMQRIIGATGEILAGWNTYDFPTVPKWHNSRMVIIGDAAHATSPSSGQGASMAIEDAIVLAKCLRDVPDTAAAFAAYEGIRRTRVEKIVAHGKRTGDSKAVGPIGRRIRDFMLPIIMRQVAKKNSLAWIDQHRITWN